MQCKAKMEVAPKSKYGVCPVYPAMIRRTLRSFTLDGSSFGLTVNPPVPPMDRAMPTPKPVSELGTSTRRMFVVDISRGSLWQQRHTPIRNEIFHSIIARSALYLSLICD
eukprot:537047-Rhodomonas_salina.2